MSANFTIGVYYLVLKVRLELTALRVWAYCVCRFRHLSIYGRKPRIRTEKVVRQRGYSPPMVTMPWRRLNVLLITFNKRDDHTTTLVISYTLRNIPRYLNVCLAPDINLCCNTLLMYYFLRQKSFDGRQFTFAEIKMVAGEGIEPIVLMIMSHPSYLCSTPLYWMVLPVGFEPTISTLKG